MPGPTLQACAFDWQLASYGLMTIDLAWLVNRIGFISRTMAPYQAAQYYRRRLEHYLGYEFDRSQWQAMLELGFLADTLRFGCFAAYFCINFESETRRAYLRSELHDYDFQIRAGVKWL